MNYTINKTYFVLSVTFMLIFGMFVVASPVKAQSSYYYDTPVYSYRDHTEYPQSHTSSLEVSCYSYPVSAQTGQSVTWASSVHGGNGSYYLTWTGTDGLNGHGSSISYSYNNPGYKSATLTVISGGQTISRNCNSTINIIGVSNPIPYYPPQTYYPPTTYYQSLGVSCNANSIAGVTGVPITWSAYPVGGNGIYTYSWTGTDNLYGSGSSIYTTYSNPGQKYASVTIYSNGQSITQSCGTGINIIYGNTYYQEQPIIYQNQYNNSTNQGLDIGCYSDPATIHVDQPVTWLVEVTGGIAPYTYSWTGTDNLSGTGQSIIKTYSTIGEKNAIVTVTSADGKTGSRSCTNTLAVRGVGTGSNIASTNTNTTVSSNTTTTGNSLSAASLFSLGNVPWGWIAILIILLLFATVLYLIFNKPKI